MQLTAVVSGASFLQGPVAPGEIVAIFGAGLGPAPLANAQLGDNGQVLTSLSGTQVFFDSVAAPLLYTSQGQVGAVVPFGTAGPTTRVQVQYQDQVSAPVTLLVAAACPSLFSSDGTGGDIGAILNQDSSPNGWGNPAPRGSIVVLYGTGGGQTTPPGTDGAIVGGLPLPTPILPVTVTVDGQPADVLYAGDAPGLIQGVMQINVRVPDAASSGAVSVVLKVGDFSSPSTVTVIVQ